MDSFWRGCSLQTEIVRSPSLKMHEYQEHEPKIKMGQTSNGIKIAKCRSLVD